MVRTVVRETLPIDRCPGVEWLSELLKIQVSQLVVHTYTSSLSCLRVKAGLKLHTEADKRTVQQGVHLLQDPEGKGLGEGGGYG